MLFEHSYGYTVFCDDIRFELDGKLSFIGVYVNDLIVNGPFPMHIPKFALGISYFEEKDVFVDDIIIRVFISEQADDDGEKIIEQIFFRKDMLPLPDQSMKGHKIFSPIIIVGFVLPYPGFLKVRAFCGSTVTPIGSLPVKQGSIVSIPVQSNSN